MKGNGQVLKMTRPGNLWHVGT